MSGGKSKPKIGEYTENKIVGRGRMGTVFQVKNCKNTLFALKKILLVEGEKQDHVKEAEIGVFLKHQNIIKTREFFLFNKQTQLVIVMEYCPEGNLAQKIRNLQQAQCLQLIEGIIKGMIYLHDKEIIHRDIKPQNILIKNGVPKIADFGMATILQASQTKSQVGTEWYKSPQVYFGQEYDFSSDIWSLGICFIEILLRKRILECLQKKKAPALTKDFPSNNLMNQITNVQIRNIIKKMLNREPTKRPTIKQIYQELYVKVFKPHQLNVSSKLQFTNLLNEYQQFPNIHEIVIGFLQIEDTQLKSFVENSSKFPNLQTIYFGNNQITGKGLKDFADNGSKFKNLQKINFSDNQITDEGLEAFFQNSSKFKNLQTIYFRTNNITGEELKEDFAENSSKFPNLQQIDFYHNQITDEGLKAFIKNSFKFPDLQKINFCCNKITDKGLKYFAKNSSKFPNLQQISFCSNKITDKEPELLFNNLNFKVFF